jgi:hypothetical protein
MAYQFKPWTRMKYWTDAAGTNVVGNGTLKCKGGTVSSTVAYSYAGFDYIADFNLDMEAQKQALAAQYDISGKETSPPIPPWSYTAAPGDNRDNYIMISYVPNLGEYRLIQLGKGNVSDLDMIRGGRVDCITFILHISGYDNGSSVKAYLAGAKEKRKTIEDAKRNGGTLGQSTYWIFWNIAAENSNITLGEATDYYKYLRVGDIIRWKGHSGLIEKIDYNAPQIGPAQIHLVESTDWGLLMVQHTHTLDTCFRQSATTTLWTFARLIPR